MEIKQMEYFCKVAQLKSFTLAAKELYVSQPTVTNCIHQLEKELNVKLFTRTTKRVSLTSEGNVFLKRVKSILASIELSIQEIKQGEKDITLLLMPNMLEDSQFIRLFLLAKKQFPNLRLKIIEDHSQLIYEHVKIGQADLGIFILPAENAELTSVTLFEDEIVLATSKFHHLINKRQIHLDEVFNEPIVLFTNDSTQQKILTNTQLHEWTFPNIIFTTTNLSRIIALIKHNLAISFLHRHHVIKETDIICHSLTPPVKTVIGIGWQKDKVLSADMKSFVSFLTHFFQEYSLCSTNKHRS